MTQEDWRLMSEQEKIQYLNNNEIVIKSKSFMDSTKKVGDYSAVSRKYKAVIGGVLMSSWKDSEQEARDAAGYNLDEMTKAVEGDQ